MISRLTKPQSGHVTTDCKTVLLIASSLPHRGWKARVCGRTGQCVNFGLVWIIGDGGRLLVVIDLDGGHTQDLLQRLFHGDWLDEEIATFRKDKA